MLTKVNILNYYQGVNHYYYELSELFDEGVMIFLFMFKGYILLTEF